MDNDLKIKLDTLKHTMDRYDHYYDSINNKGNLYLTLNTFILGGMIAGYFNIKEVLGESCFGIIIFWLGLICTLLSIAFTLWAIIPYLNKQEDSDKGSFMNFGYVSRITFASFKKMYTELSEENGYEDYLQQVYLLSKGLHLKFNRLRTATYLLGGTFVCVIIIGIKILK